MAETTQLRVFVSHSHEDDAFCRTVVQALREAGADVWYDEHNLGSGQLMSVIQRELSRPVFIVILSKSAFASRWVKRETTWAYEMYDRDPSRLILPVTAGQIERDDFSPQNEWLFLHDFKRVEAPGFAPFAPDEAANRLLRALGLTPAGEAPAPIAPQPTEDVDDLLTRGKALIAQDKYAEALPLFERASQLAPSSFDAWANLGYVLGELGRYQEALAADERALGLDDQQAWVWNCKGKALGGLGRYQEELVALDRALALDSNYAIAWNNKGTAFNGLKRSDEALAAYDRALALDPNLAAVWSNKGAAFNGLKRSDEALAAYDRALALDPDYALAWNNKGNALWGMKRFADAVVAYDRALALDPNLAQAWNNKAISLRALGRTAEAEAAEQRAKALGG